MSTRTVHSNSVFGALTQKLTDYKLLIKFRLSALVVFSSVMAFLITAPSAAFSWTAVLALIVGGMLVTGAANALNQVLERDYDKLMTRTANRPLPTGRMTVSEAVIAAGLMSMVGIIVLSLFNPLTGLLGMLSLILYSFIYTPMKRVSPIAVVIGAIPGALPTMIGCVAFGGQMTSLAIVLFGIQFLWQFPHFYAIAWLSFEDYTKAGFHLLPSKRGVKDENAGRQSFYYALLLLPVSLTPYMMGISGIGSAIFVAVIGLLYIYFSWDFFKKCTRKTALKLMFSSFFYLPLVLIALYIDKI